MTEVTIGTWGTSLAVLLPGEIVRASRLQNGARVEVFMSDRDIVIRQLSAESELTAWFSGKSPDHWRAEYAAADVDWGPDVGRERVPE